MSTDRRNCFRIATPDTRGGLFVSPGLRLPALILNESATGFAILVDTPTQLQPNDLASLESDGAWNRVRVIRTEDVPGGHQALGLERLNEDDDPPVTMAYWRGLIPRGLHVSPVALLIAAGVFVAAAILGMVSLGKFGNQDYGETRVIGGERRAKPAKSPSKAVRVKENTSSTSTDSTFESGNEKKPRGKKSQPTKISKQAAQAVDKITEQVAQDLPSPHALAKLTALAPERLDQWREQLASLPWESSQLHSVLSLDLAYLNLSAHQQEVIAGIVRRVVAELRLLAGRAGPDETKAEMARQVETSAVNEIGNVFTPQQRAQWQAMSIDTQAAATR